MILETAENALSNPEVENAWSEMALGWPNATPEQRVSALQYILSRRDRALNALREIADDDQLVETLAVLYIELKCEWIMINTVVNYQLFRKGDGDGETILRGALTASLLERVESLLGPEDVQAITNFLAQPVRQRRHETPAADARNAA